MFVDEVIKVENKMVFFLKNTKKKIVEKIIFIDFVNKKLFLIK